MDEPLAKWTLDVCIDQSQEWPIYISKRVSWPDAEQVDFDTYLRSIKQDASLEFMPYVLAPREALVFSGSSQWHYRDRMEQRNKNNYCHLIFFHFRPKGSYELVTPRCWADKFNLDYLRILH